MDINVLVKEPKTKRGKETLNRICDSAKKLFYEKGYHGSTINDITDEAHIAAGTFYLYFNDKLSLYKYLLLQFSHEIRTATRLATVRCTTRYESEYYGLKAFLEYVSTHKYAYHIIWESLYIDYELFKEYYESFALRYMHGLQEAQETHEVKDLDLTVLSYMLMGVANFIGLKWAVFEDRRPYDDVVTKVLNILQNGMFERR